MKRLIVVLAVCFSVVAASLAAVPAALAHEPVTETYQVRVAPFTETYAEQVQVGTEAYQVRVAPYTASHTYYTTETRTTCVALGCITLDIRVPHTVTWQVYHYETRTRPVYETQTRTRSVYNYLTRTRQVHHPHYEPPSNPEPCCLTPNPQVTPGPGGGDGQPNNGVLGKVGDAWMTASKTVGDAVSTAGDAVDETLEDVANALDTVTNPIVDALPDVACDPYLGVLTSALGSVVGGKRGGTGGGIGGGMLTGGGTTAGQQTSC